MAPESSAVTRARHHSSGGVARADPATSPSGCTHAHSCGSSYFYSSSCCCPDFPSHVCRCGDPADSASSSVRNPASKKGVALLNKALASGHGWDSVGPCVCVCVLHGEAGHICVEQPLSHFGYRKKTFVHTYPRDDNGIYTEK